MKKIWLICLCLASLSLAWCFHVPDEDRLPSRNKVKTGDINENAEIEQAIDSLMEWFDIASSQLDDMDKNKGAVYYEEWNENAIKMEDETLNNENIIENNNEIVEETEKNKGENQGIQEDTISEE